jgi:hypothetical protein
MSKLSDKAIEIAKTQIGKKENPLGSNWGEPVKTYLKSVKIGFPASWCMAFVYWCFENAATQLNVTNTAIKTGGVLAAWNSTNAIKMRSSEPQVGAVFIMSFGGGLGHTGIVTKFDAKYIWTIEGNTNDTGAREGIEVCTKKRSRSSIKGYLLY